MLKYKDVLLLKLDKKTYYIEILKSEHDTDTLRLCRLNYTIKKPEILFRFEYFSIIKDVHIIDTIYFLLLPFWVLLRAINGNYSYL